MKAQAGAVMYTRLFSVVAILASVTFASALAQVDANLQPTQYPLSPRWVRVFQHRAWVRELTLHLLKYTRHPNGREGTVVIRFVLNRAGHVVSAKVEKSSGDAVLDKAALETVRVADPLPPPPPLVTDQQLTCHLPIRFLP
jgi:TonB family protein